MTPHYNAYIEPEPTYWFALLIGICYTKHPNQKARLQQPHKDVDMIRDFLLDRGWLPENIKVLADRPGDEEPNKANLLAAIDALVAPGLANPGQSYKFVFYYAGHGAQEEDPLHIEVDWLNEAIVPTDANIMEALYPTNPVVIASPTTAGPLSPSSPVTGNGNASGKIKFLASDCAFEMTPRRGRRGVRGGSSKAGDEVPELMKAQVTSDHGWIIDDILFDKMCRFLPPTCRLRAFFDMCHSGTALDLPYNYVSNHIPWLHRLQFRIPALRSLLVGPRVAIAPQIQPAPPTLPKCAKDAWNEPPSPKHKLLGRRVKSIPSSVHNVTRAIVVDVPVKTFKKTSKLALIVGRGIRRLILCSPQHEIIEQLAGLPVVHGPTATAAPHVTLHAVNGPTVIIEVHHVDPNGRIEDGEQAGDISLLTPPLTAVSEGDSSDAGAFLKPADSLTPLPNPFVTPPLTPPAGVVELHVEVDSMALQVDVGGALQRSVSAPRAGAGNSTEAVGVLGDVLCLGACSDDQLGDDSRSLARVLIGLYKKYNGNLTHAQLLLEMSRHVRKPQIPQLSSSRELNTAWGELFLL